MSLTLERLLFDPSDADGSPNLGAYLRSSDGTLLTHTTDGSKEALDVNMIGTSDGGVFAEDSAHTSTDRGMHILAVRNDTQGSLVDTDGDYGSLQLDASGRLRTICDIDLLGDIVGDDEVDSEDPLKVGSHAYDQSSALGTVDAGDKANLASDRYRRILMSNAPAVGIEATAASVDDTIGGTALPASALAGRQRVLIQNNGADPIFFGDSGVTTATGLEIGKGATLDIQAGEAIGMYAIAEAGKTVDVRVVELA